MKYKSLYIVFASSLLILFVLVYQGTFAYFTSNVADDRRGEDAGKTALSTADLEDLTLVNSGNSDGSLWIPGTTKDFTFKINNPSSVALCVKLVWKDVSNTWVNKNDLVFTLTDSKGTDIVSSTPFPSNDDEVLVASFQVPNGENNYTIKVTYTNTNENQYEDMGQSFRATVEGQLTECSSWGGG